jgi:hypothetical protein
MAFAFDIADGMLDSFNSDGLFIYSRSIESYALTSGQQDYEIGPSATAPFDVTRPQRVINANLVITSQSPEVSIPLYIIDAQQWMGIPVTDIDATYPTQLYYESSYPEGVLHFWPKPTSGLSVELETWNQLSEFDDLDTAFSFPPGYYELGWTNLAERLCIPAFGYDSVPQSIAKRAADARSRIQSLNQNPPPVLGTDYGIQGTNQQTGYRNLYNPAPYWYR